MSETQCRHFNGYKPCSKSQTCARGQCSHFESVQSRLLVIHLGALGAVLRSTSLLKAIRRKFPRAQLTWVTQAPAHHLLKGLPDIDRVFTLSAEDQLQLRALHFDTAFVIDKSLTAAGVLSLTKVDQIFGFKVNSGGAIVPANGEARELWELGLSDQKKFFHNKKSEQQLVHEALALGDYGRDEYQVSLAFSEMAEVAKRREQWSPHGRPIIGINTGCSDAIPFKKLSIEGHRTLIREIQEDARFKNLAVVLLGGGVEDEERNRLIAHGLPVFSSPTTKGLRDGLVSVAACDAVLTGDSLGMHMAIALKKWVVAWFGPTCQQEIDLYARGAKILTKASCSPCWKRHCDKPLMCYDQVDFAEMRNALARGLSQDLGWKNGASLLSNRLSW